MAGLDLDFIFETVLTQKAIFLAPNMSYPVSMFLSFLHYFITKFSLMSFSVIFEHSHHDENVNLKGQ